MKKQYDNSWIGTYTGKHFWVLDPKPEEVCIEDITHALSQICRFAGHTEGFCSVATHCLNVERFLEARAYSPLIRLYGLLHDAAEAYVGDMSRPMKVCCPGFKEIEDGVQKAIYKHFGLAEPTPSIIEVVKEADDYILTLEARRFMSSTERWNLVPVDAGAELTYTVSGGIVEAMYTVKLEDLLKVVKA